VTEDRIHAVVRRPDGLWRCLGCRSMFNLSEALKHVVRHQWTEV